MKFLPLLFLLCGPVFAGEVQLAWDASPSPGITNYILYAHTNALTKTNLSTAVVKVSAGTNTTASLDNLATGTWWLTVTASKGGVQSDPSNILIIDVPQPPAQMRSVVIQYSATLTNGFNDLGFFRLRIPSPP